MLAAAPVWASQVSITLPASVPSETVFIRYVLAGQKLGGWVQPKTGVSSYSISTSVGGVPATGIKAIVYARGNDFQSVLGVNRAPIHDDGFARHSDIDACLQ